MPPKILPDTNPIDVNTDHHHKHQETFRPISPTQPYNEPLVRAISTLQNETIIQRLIDECDNLPELRSIIFLATHRTRAPEAWKKQILLAVYKKGANPLIIAILEEKKTLSEIEQLIAQADLTATNDCGYAALSCTFLANFYSQNWKNSILEDIILRLLVKGAPSHLSTLMIMRIAVIEEYIKIIDFLVTKYPELTSGIYSGNTFLHIAINCNRIKSAEYLIAHMSFLELNIRDAKGKTALDLAVTKQQDGIVLALLKQEANPTIQSNNNDNLLHWGAEYGHIEIAQFLAEKYPLLITQQTTDHGNTPVHKAILAGKVEIVKILLAKIPPNFFDIENLRRESIFEIAYNMAKDKDAHPHAPEILDLVQQSIQQLQRQHAQQYQLQQQMRQLAINNSPITASPINTSATPQLIAPGLDNNNHEETKRALDSDDKIITVIKKRRT